MQEATGKKKEKKRKGKLFSKRWVLLHAPFCHIGLRAYDLVWLISWNREYLHCQVFLFCSRNPIEFPRSGKCQKDGYTFFKTEVFVQTCKLLQQPTAEQGSMTTRKKRLWLVMLFKASVFRRWRSEGKPRELRFPASYWSALGSSETTGKD